jgi:hypothetical protein
MKKLLLIIGIAAVFFVSTMWGGEIASEYKAHHDKVTLQELIGSRDIDQSRANDTGITEIGMERTGCYGKCPAYTVIIKSDGTLRYKGEQYAKLKGEHAGKTSQWELNGLFQFIRDSGYFAMQDGYFADVTDLPTVYTYVVQDGKKKIISNYAISGPTKLWAIEQIIDKLLLEAKWDSEK